MLYPNIAAERAKRNMSLEALASELGVSRKTVYNWEQAGNLHTLSYTAPSRGYVRICPF